MEILGRLIRQDILKNKDGTSQFLEKPLYTFMVEDEQEEFCCPVMQSHLAFMRFTPNENIELATSITSAYICLDERGQPPNHIVFVHKFKYCPNCAEPFHLKIIKYTKYVEIRKIETTYQFVEVDDDIKVEP